MNFPSGFQFAGVACGIRANEPDRLDLALVFSERPATAAGVFTQNQVCAAPVHVCRERLPRADARGIVICSGNANACTGDEGMTNARAMTSLYAQAQGLASEQMLVCSTGVIGFQLPMEQIRPGIAAASQALAPGSATFELAARAIMTTDTKPKMTSRGVGGYTLVGFAKGAAMIGPNMATMLGFLLTDAPVRSDDLQAILRASVQDTFNCISVEGHTSTNDTVLILANGPGEPLSGAALEAFAVAVHDCCEDLAKAIAQDAEGANHFVTIDVEGCRTDAEARQVAKTIAESALVKTAICGADPNWGRFVSAAGYSGVIFDEKELTLWMGPMELYRAGTPLPFDKQAAIQYLLHNRDVHLHLKFTLGPGRCRFYTCDLTEEYVRLNAEYTT